MKPLKVVVSERSAFTLIEVLIVLTLAGTLLVAATTLLVNLTLLRAKPVQMLEYATHLQNLTNFLQSAFKGDTLPPAYWLENDNEALTLERFPDQSSSQPPYLEFRLPGDHPLIASKAHYAQSVRTQLVFIENDGLYLHWLIESNDPREPNGTEYFQKLSPWVQAFRYGYYNATFNHWEIEDALQFAPDQPGVYELPDCLLIEFRESVDQATTTIPIYLPQAEVPVDAT